MTTPIWQSRSGMRRRFMAAPRGLALPSRRPATRDHSRMPSGASACRRRRTALGFPDIGGSCPRSDPIARPGCRPSDLEITAPQHFRDASGTVCEPVTEARRYRERTGGGAGSGISWAINPPSQPDISTTHGAAADGRPRLSLRLNSLRGLSMLERPRIRSNCRTFVRER